MIISSTPFLVWTPIARGRLTLYFTKDIEGTNDIDIDKIQRDIQFIEQNNSVPLVFAPLNDGNDDDDDDAPRLTIQSLNTDSDNAVFMGIGKVMLIFFLIYCMVYCCRSLNSAYSDASEESIPLLGGTSAAPSNMQNTNRGAAVSSNQSRYPSYQNGNV